MLIQNWAKTCITHYSNRDPVNLSDVFVKVRVASKITLLLFSLNRESPNKSKSFLLFSDKNSKFWNTDFTLFIRLRNGGSAIGNV